MIANAHATKQISVGQKFLSLAAFPAGGPGEVLAVDDRSSMLKVRIVGAYGVARELHVPAGLVEAWMDGRRW